MTEPMSRAEAEELAGQLRPVLDALKAGELTAGPTARAFLAGALAALDAVAGRRPFTFPEPDAGT